MSSSTPAPATTPHPARRRRRCLAGATLAVGALCVVGGGGVSAAQEQWNDEVGLSASSICPSGGGWLARLVITWSTDNPSEPPTDFGLFGAPAMSPRYAGFSGAASGSTSYDFEFTSETDLMVNMVWGMAVGNEQAYLTVAPQQQGDCGDAPAETTTTEVAPTSSPAPTPAPTPSPAPSPSTPSGGGSSGGGSSSGSSASAPALPRTGASTGVFAAIAAVVGGAGLALVGITRRRAER